MTDSVHCRRLLTPEGWLRDATIRWDGAGHILSVEQGAAGKDGEVLPGPVIPGMPNCHSHAFQRQMAGLAGFPAPGKGDSFWTWREAMYRLANRLDPDRLQAVARWLYVEMLEAGYTSCAEFHYVHHQPDGRPYEPLDWTGACLLEAASSSGMALTLLPVLYCRAGFNEETVQPKQRRFASSPEQFMQLFESSLDRVEDDPHHVVGLAFHSLRAVSKAQLDEVLAGERGRAAAVHIHIAEQAAEVEQCEVAYGARPVDWLLANAPVDDRWCLVHATHMAPREYEAAAASGATIGLCPTTEADLGDGFFEAEHWLDQGGRFAIGSDSNLRVSPAEELRLLEFGLRLRTGRRNVLADTGRSCGRYLYEAAAEGGRMALGQPVGRIAEGFRADLVELEDNHPLLRGVADGDIVDRYVFAGERDMVRTVFTAGQKRVSEGAHLDRNAAAAGFVAAMEELGQ